MGKVQELARQLVESLEKARSHCERQKEAMRQADACLAEVQDALSGPDAEGAAALPLRQALAAARAQLAEARADAAPEAAEELTRTAGQLREELERCEDLAQLGELSASVAHEIRNPLCGMIFSLEVLQTKMDPEDSRRCLLDNVRREAEKMEKIVQNLLHFARNYEPHPAPCALEELLRESVNSVRSHLERRKIRVRIRHESGNGHASIDPELMQQVFRNLLLNSVDVSPEGAALDIELLQRPGNEMAIAFRDHGEGMGEDQLERIFEPFYTSKEKGVGLGLTVCRKIVEAHKGRIEVASRPGAGSTFTVVFPTDCGDCANGQG